jgi:hypothetical protein
MTRITQQLERGDTDKRLAAFNGFVSQTGLTKISATQHRPRAAAARAKGPMRKRHRPSRLESDGSRLVANDGKRQGTNLAGGIAILVGLAATGMYFFHRDAPFLDLHPGMTEAGIREQAVARQQKVDARLWQDPFAAAANALELSRSGCPEACNSPLAAEEEGTQSPGRDRPSIPMLLPQRGPTPLSHLYKEMRDLNTFTGPAPAPPAVVPYERFEKTLPRPIPYLSLDPPRNAILVLWLNEEILRGEPLQKLSELVKFLGGDHNFKLIGPYSSDMLRDMVSEARRFVAPAPDFKKYGLLWKQDFWPALNNVRFFAYGATTADNQLLGNLTETYGTVQRFFEDFGIHLQRTVATDVTLAHGIAGELKRRHVRPGYPGGVTLL